MPNIGRRIGIPLASLALLLAGCGRFANVAPMAATAATSALARAQSTAGPASITGISGDGHVATNFSIMAGMGIELKAIVSNPTNLPLTYHWDTNGGGWSDETQPTFDFMANWEGLYDATCTILDASGHALDSKHVTIDVWSIPSPPPVPPIPVPHA